MTLETGQIRTKGRAARLPTVLGVRSLTSGEVEAHTTREAGVKPTPLQRLSSRHRQCARLVAEGRSTSEVAHAVGLSVSRVSILKGDPSFQELVALHQQEIGEIFLGFNERMAGLGEDMTDELRRRIEDEPDSFENDELMRGVQVLADRTGYAPKRVEEKHHFFNIGERLDEARRRATKVIETSYTEVEEGEAA